MDYNKVGHYTLEEAYEWLEMSRVYFEETLGKLTDAEFIDALTEVYC